MVGGWFGVAGVAALQPASEVVEVDDGGALGAVELGVTQANAACADFAEQVALAGRRPGGAQ